MSSQGLAQAASSLSTTGKKSIPMNNEHFKFVVISTDTEAFLLNLAISPTLSVAHPLNLGGHAAMCSAPSSVTPPPLSTVSSTPPSLSSPGLNTGWEAASSVQGMLFWCCIYSNNEKPF